MLQCVFPLSIHSLLKSFAILCETLTINLNKLLSKMNDRVPKERLGNSRLSDVFSKSTRMTSPQNFRNKKLALI